MVQLSSITISFNKMGKPSEKEILHMKKLLSVVLAMLMVMSTVSFAAPSMADTFGATEEVVSENVPAVEADIQDEAALAEESEYGTLIYDVDFDSASVTTMGQTMDKYSSVAVPEGSLHLQTQSSTLRLPKRKLQTAFLQVRARQAQVILTSLKPH